MSPRRNGLTLQQIVFRELRAGGQQSASRIAAATGERRESCRRACAYLAKRGLAQAHRAGYNTTWSLVPGAREPRDLRGTRRASRNHRGPVAWAHWLRMMRAKHGSQWVPPVRDCALAQAWRHA